MHGIEGFDLETERPQSPDEAAAQRSSARQFSLRSLMVFVALCLMYCSQFTVFRAAFSRDIGWATAATIATTWLCLAIFYYGQRLTVLFAIHLLSPAVFGALSFSCVPTEVWRIGAATLGRDVAIVGLIANLISFPAALLILFARAVSRRPAPK